MSQEDQQTITLDELIQAKASLENDLEMLTTSHGHLRGAQQRFVDNIASCCQTEIAKEGDEVMLPLSSTVYVTGQMVSPDRMTVDVGTGYYVEMSTSDAIEYYKRKIAFIQTQVQTLERLVTEKRGQLMYVMRALQSQA